MSLGDCLLFPEVYFFISCVLSRDLSTVSHSTLSGMSNESDCSTTPGLSCVLITWVLYFSWASYQTLLLCEPLLNLIWVVYIVLLFGCLSLCL